MKKYIFTLLLAMLALSACKDEQNDPEYNNNIPSTNQVAQNEDTGKIEDSDKKEIEKYYELPILTVIKDGESRVMKKNESALVYDLIDNLEWSVTPEENFENDYVIMDNTDVLYEFNSKTNVLKDTNNDIYIKLHKELAVVLLLALDGEL